MIRFRRPKTNRHPTRLSDQAISSQVFSVASKFQSRIEPLQTLHALLPAWCQELSLGRAQIAFDLIRSSVESSQPQRLVAVSAGDFSQGGPPRAAAIAVQGASLSNSTPSDFATLVHAGPLSPLSSRDESGELAGLISQTLDQDLRRRGVEFMQWSTDQDSLSAAVDGNSHGNPLDWRRAFGFQPLATLDYLSGNVPTHPSPTLPLPHLTSPADPSGATLVDCADQFADQFADECALPRAETQQPESLRLETLRWKQPDDLAQFAELITETYQVTRDCPRFTQYRSATQTLDTYRVSAAFAPSLWFRISEAASSRPIGCLILARHGMCGPHEDGSGQVIEVVYMGLIPSARGKGHGRRIFQCANQIARSERVTRIILAVDQQNHPARSIYLRAGLQAILSETVWAKSLTRT